jgi:hypothetical protein
LGREGREPKQRLGGQNFWHSPMRVADMEVPTLGVMRDEPRRDRMSFQRLIQKRNGTVLVSQHRSAKNGANLRLQPAYCRQVRLANLRKEPWASSDVTG